MINLPANHTDDKACMNSEKRQDLFGEKPGSGLEKLEKVFW